jgi:hypothetical protein
MTLLACWPPRPAVLGGGRHGRPVHGLQPVGRARAGRAVGARGAAAEFYGLWTFAVRLSAIVGPITYGLVTWLTAGNHRLAILTTGVCSSSHRPGPPARSASCCASATLRRGSKRSTKATPSRSGSGPATNCACQLALGHEGAWGAAAPPPAPGRRGSWRGCRPARRARPPAGARAPAHPAACRPAAAAARAAGGRSARPASGGRVSGDRQPHTGASSANSARSRARRTAPRRAAAPAAAQRSRSAPAASRSHCRLRWPAPAEAALLDQLAAGRAPHLAARGLEHRVRRRQHDLVGRLADRLTTAAPTASRSLALVRRRCARGDLGQHHQALGAAAGSGLPNTATQPLRTPDPPTASSISCGYRLRPPRITMSLTRPVT